MTRRFLVLLTVLAVAFAGGAAYVTWHNGSLPALVVPAVEECQAHAAGRTVDLDLEQSRYAALIAAVAVQRGMPARAATIALAAAYQESDLRNVSYGDRDSVGLFQQRPSQGWGSRAEILQPAHAINAFYDALDRVDGYESMPVTVAAQRVQRSGFPTAYADHEPDARVLASALTGNSRAAFWCILHDQQAAGAVARRTAAVRADLDTAFGDLPSSPSPGAESVGLAIQPGGNDKQRGWAVASYLVGQAHRLGIAAVSYDGRVWRAGSGSAHGWQRTKPTSGSTAGAHAALDDGQVHLEMAP